MNCELEKKIELFCEAFGDSRSTAEEFFSCGDVITVCEYVGDRLAAMASLIPIMASSNKCYIEHMSQISRQAKGFYVYGVCVKKEFRGCGLFLSIMKKVDEFALTYNADFLCLIPADQALAQTYKKWGYDISIMPTGAISEKQMLLMSEDFRKFAIPSDDLQASFKEGVLKIINDEYFSAVSGEYSFGDYMGDV